MPSAINLQGNFLNKFLFITYYYPPAGGPSVQRIIRIIQHMAQSGWQGVVLTVREGDYTTEDPGLAERIPAGTDVLRTDFFEPYKLYRRFTGKKAADKIPLAVLSAHSKASYRERIANLFRANLLVPDGRIGWYRCGVRTGIEAVQRDPAIKLVLSSGPPHTVHLIARKIAQKTGLPFIADFRDPWVNIDYYTGVKRNRLITALDRRLEAKVLRSADAITVVGPGCRDQLLQNHNDISLSKTHIIYNGFDPSIYPADKPNPPQERFVITYIGNLPFNRFTPSLYRAISQLNQEGKIAPDVFQLHFYGGIDEAVRRELAGFKIEPYLHFHGFVPHNQAIRATMESYLLLLIINDAPTQKGIVPGKMFEYMASERPVLAIGPLDGDAARIYHRTGSGVFFDYLDELGIKTFIMEQFDNWKQGKWRAVRSPGIHDFNGAVQMKKMSQLFDKLIEKSVASS